MRYLFLLLALTSFGVQAQEEDLFALFESDEAATTEFTYATFKGTRLINAQTNELTSKGELEYIISHRFGSFTDRYLYNFLGLDNAQIRMQLDYGLTDRMTVGVGRSSVFKVSDSFVKYQLLQQRTGKNPFPVSVVLHSNVNYRAADYTDGIAHHASDRLSYTHQVIVARKVNSKASWLIIPGVVHWNLVPTPADQNTVGTLTLGGRYKLTQRMALTGEYSMNTINTVSKETFATNPVSVGLDIETGGHVFQFHLGNVRTMSDPYWLTRNDFNPLKGQLFLGFNISRVFAL